MADRTLLWDDLLLLTGLRQASYEILESEGLGLACLDASGRRGADWYFARRWITVREGRRVLYHAMDRLEAAGFRFRVRGADRAGAPPGREDAPWPRASHMWNELEPLERRIHEDLFPDEARLLQEGYDWDSDRVYARGRPMPVDGFGRYVETTPEGTFEWVRVADEATWRRYPLHRARRALTSESRT